MTILHYAGGDLKLIINELDVETLTHEQGGERVKEHVLDSFKEYLDKKLPKAMERALFSNDAKRHRGETMIQYISRKKTLLNELDRAKCPLPSNAKGYLMLRDAGLPEKAWDTVETWTHGAYELPEIVTSLRKLERPIPGKGTTHIAGMSGFIGDDGSATGGHTDNMFQDSGELSMVFMVESLFVLPDSFDETQGNEALRFSSDPEVLYVAGDLPDDIVLTEDEAVAIYANYGQVREYLHKQRLGRGFFKPGQPSGGRSGGKGGGRSGGKGSSFQRNTGAPKRWSKKFLMSKSKCARCGKMGHWARECTNEPDERGKRRSGMTGFMSICDLSEQNPVVQENSAETTGQSFVFVVSFIGVDTTVFVGLTVTPGYGLVDTGAQHGVVGTSGYNKLEELLAVHGLKPREVETLSMKAAGVGGTTSFTKSSEIPVGIGGASGLITINVIDQDIPLLLPVEFCRGLGMVLDLPDMDIYWKNLDRHSDVHEVGNGGHIAIDIFEFPKTGWINPHENTAKVVGDSNKRNPTVKRSEYELKTLGSSSRSEGTLIAHLGKSGSSHVGSASMSDHSGELQRGSTRTHYGRGRGGQTVEYRSACQVEDLRDEALLGARELCDEAKDRGSLGQEHVPTRVPADKEAGCPDGRNRHQDHPGRDCGKGDLSSRGNPERRTSHVSASDVQHEATGKQDKQVVDLHPVPVTLGTAQSRGQHAGRTANGPGDLDVRQTSGKDVLLDPRTGCSLLPVGTHDDGILRGKLLEPVSAVGAVLDPSGPPRGAATDSGGSSCGRGRGFNERRLLGGTSKMVNKIITGSCLASMLSLPLVGYVAQIVSGGTPYRSLEGPVFGERVGILQGASEEGPWKSYPTTEPLLGLASGETGGWSGIGLQHSTKEPPLGLASGETNDECKDWRLILYKTTTDAALHSTEDDGDSIHTVPRAVTRAIIRSPVLAETSFCAPLEAIPEDQVPPDLLPEERIADDPNAEPDSDEEEPPPVHQEWQPDAQELRDLAIAHDNAGHPNNTDFARLLRRGNAKPEVASWVRRNYTCEACESNKMPKARRPAAIPKTYRFNHVVGIDLVEVKNLRQEKEYWLNCICWGASFQLVSRVGGDGRKTPENVWNTFVRTWVRIFGMPEVLVLDPGTEFQGYFSEMAASHGCAVLPTDPRAPWQNGRTERAGKEWKKQFRLARRKDEPLNDDEFVALGELCCSMRNRYNNRAGFSPMQRVFGFTHRLPGSLLSDDVIDPQYLSEDPLQDFNRSEQLRQAATRAWAATDNRARLLKVLRARHRIPQTFTEGQLVFVWRQPKVGPGRWHGPGVVVLPTAGGAWINMRGSLWRVSNEQMRGATNEESLGAEIVNRYLTNMRLDLQKSRGARRYVDVMREGPPRFPGDPQIQEDEELPGHGPSDNEDSEPEQEGTPAEQEREASRGRNETGEPPVRRQRIDTVSEPGLEPSRPGTPQLDTPPSEVVPDFDAPVEGSYGAAARASGNQRTAPYPYPFDRTSANFYIEKVEDEGDETKSFVISQAEVCFDARSEAFFIRKKRPGDEICVNKLDPKAQKLFLGPGGSREKEWNSIKAPGNEGVAAIKIHRGKEAQELRQKYKDRIVPSRWHEKWKDMGDGFDNGLKDPNVSAHLGAKSRWILQGFHDPDIHLLNRSVPTPETSDVPLALQIIASLRALGWIGDIKSAFTQGIKGLRPDRLFASPPAGGVPGEDNDILIELLAEVYGLITGPPAWRKTLLVTFKELGFKRHPLAPCVALMYETIDGTPDRLSGVIVVETDDLLGGGIGDQYHGAVEELRRRFKFGKWTQLQEKSDEYGGRTLKQHSNYSFTISMVRYLRERAREIHLPRGRCKEPEADATEAEITAMRGLTGKLNWTVREGMPQGCGDASLLSATMPKPKVKDLQEANASLRRLLQHNATITIQPIPLDRLRLLSFSDSSLGNAAGGTTQVAFMVCAVDASIYEGAEADLSILTYKSHRMHRAGSATLLVESNAMSEALAETEWVASWIGLAKDLQYDLRKRDTLNREFRVTTIMTESQADLNAAAITDAKSLYDNLSREQFSGAEKRAALEICVIRDSLEALGGKPKWVPHEKNPVDCMTKLKGNAACLLQLMKDARYKLVEEEQEMIKRKAYREMTGKRNPRPNKTVLFQHSNSTNTNVSFNSFLVTGSNSVSEGSTGSVESGIGIVATVSEAMNEPKAAPQRAYLPMDPEAPVQGERVFTTYAHKQHCATICERLKKDIASRERAIELMNQGGLDEAAALEPDKPAVLAKLERRKNLRTFLTIDQIKLEEVEAQMNQSATDFQVDRTSEKSQRYKVPGTVYDAMVYLEARAIQRARLKQQQAGLFHQATHRQWKRLLYSRVRTRLHHYKQDKKTQEDKRASASTPSWRPGDTLQSEDWNTVDASQMVDSEAAEQQFLLKSREDADAEANAEIAGDSRSSRYGRVLEPKREKRDRTTTTAGVAYLKRKRQNKRRNRREREKGQQRSSETPAPPDNDESESEQAEDDREEVKSEEVEVVKEEEFDKVKLEPEEKPPGYYEEAASSSAQSSTWRFGGYSAWHSQRGGRGSSSAEPQPDGGAVKEELDTEDTIKQEEDENEQIEKMLDDQLKAEVPSAVPVPGLAEGEEIDLTRIEIRQEASFVDVSLMNHWSDAILMSKANKSEYWTPVFNRDRFKDPSTWSCDVDCETVAYALRMAGFRDREITTISMLDIPNLPTIGKWFHVTTNQGGQSPAAFWASNANLKVAYHASALSNLRSVITTGLVQGPSATSGVNGIYCEGTDRMSCCLNYMTHVNVPGKNPLIMYGVLLECLVNRDMGRTIHSQWVQPQHGITITGIYIHTFNLAHCYTPGFSGWYRVAAKDLRLLQNLVRI